jgi:hypothetical protein
MKNITLSAPEPLIEAARLQAVKLHSTLNAEFRKWLESFTERQKKADEALAIIDKIAELGMTDQRKYTREEMNTRR